MVSKRFILTIISFIVICLAAAGAIFLAKGYRLNSKQGTIAGTGILSVTSVPDQASVYLDGHLTTATNENINSLTPKTYEVKIVKEGYIPWEKKVDVREGLVSDVKATLFRAIPTVYPLTYTGATNPILSPDGEKMLYIVPPFTGQNVSPTQARKAGLWVWTMSDNSIAFARGAQPSQIGLPTVDYTKATYRWSPDSAEVMATFPDATYLFDATKLNDPPRDITATLSSTLRSWDEDQKTKDLTRLELIGDVAVRNIASSSAVLKWSPDETKFLYGDGKSSYKVVDLNPNKGLTKQIKTFDLPPSPRGYTWLPDSQHLFLVEASTSPNPIPSDPVLLPQSKEASSSGRQVFAKIAVIEYDGANKSDVYAGSFDPDSVFVWPDGSRLVVVSSFPTPTASLPNLFGINLK